MNLDQLINILHNSFNKPLPGVQTHIELAPYRRKIEINHFGESHKIASTLLLIYPKENELYFCLIERTEYEGTHSKQISFPGGRNENNETKVETAIRETKEEVGIDPLLINVIGELTQVFVPPSNYLIHPFIGYCYSTPTFEADPVEVKTIIEVKINDLFKPNVIKKKKMSFGKKDLRYQMDIPYLDLNDRVVWGATGVILNEFRHLLLDNIKD